MTRHDRQKGIPSKAPEDSPPHGSSNRHIEEPHTHFGNQVLQVSMLFVASLLAICWWANKLALTNAASALLAVTLGTVAFKFSCMNQTLIPADVRDYIPNAWYCDVPHMPVMSGVAVLVDVLEEVDRRLLAASQDNLGYRDCEFLSQRTTD